MQHNPVAQHSAHSGSHTAIERKIFLKVTLRIIPILILCFFINYIDRANLGVLFSPISKELNLSASAFGFAAGIFFLGYLVFEVPSNMAIVRFGARLWIARIMISWGIVTCLLSATHSVPMLYTLRFLLGVAEAGFFPGVLFYLTFWYPRHLLGQAYLALELSVPVSLALGSVVTAGLLLMDGVAGIAGWRWAFALEGIPAVLMGILVLFILPDNPKQAKWLTQEERDYLLSKTSPDHGDGKADLKELKAVVFDSLTWLYIGLEFSIIIGFWAVTYFLPKIMQERFHVNPVDAGLISSIPWLAAVFGIALVVWTSRKTGDRKWHLLISLLLSAIGLCITAKVDSPVVGLVGLCISAAGVQAAVPLFWTIPVMSFSGARAAIAIAFINSVASTAGLVGPWILGISHDLTGTSRTGLYVMSAFFLVSAFLAFHVSQSRSKADAGRGALDISTAGTPHPGGVRIE
ncbi:MFS transporter [Paraburkholderia hospita]|uniref:MFS transporter n=1 Tax=Paraburkholderia hospita TaxID=169430 RepID=A0AAN1JEV1_9BURK|nr:MFS transporter [Paraburkholderia hospita]AUT72435.1 MFS transporter [Paraburkholderia hospita]EIN00777.1 major facilitator superfamily metabolite/H(+) symporter [Paraburkholderia hospita]OUL70745.1 MFS transporter [Paraburkholderia hospita]OUL75604.1 MFS transporter [Paraburkholderia hospita]SEI00966.1 Sugar phosphate permease [Paraburkholderia hospita]